LIFPSKEAIRLNRQGTWIVTTMQNKTPIIVLTGLAIVAAAAIAGLTRDRWMAEAPPAATTAPSTEATTEQPAASATPEATAEQPAATTTAEQPAATTTAEQPAATTTAEQPAATTTAEQPAATTIAEQPAATTTAEQPAATTTAEQPAATTTAEQPAATTTAEQPAATTTAEQPAATTTAEQPAPAQPAGPQSPAFDTVRVEKTGEAVIAGTAAPGSEVTARLDGEAIGKTTANTDGAFVIIPDKPLPEGSGALTLESRLPGDAAVVTSKQSVAVIVPAGGQQQALVAVVSPDQPTKILQKPAVPGEQPARMVSIDAVDYDANGNIVFSGQGGQGHTARVYVDNAMMGDAAVGEDGRWSFSATASVAPGNHMLRVDGLDAEGKVVNRIEVPFFREDQTKVADATQPAATTGESGSGAADTGAATPSAPREGRVVIQPGNNLWRISRVLYGSGAKYTVLYEANKGQIRNPDLIYPGQIFKTPDVAAKSETIDPKRRDPLKPDENAAPSQ
jgi:chemotaxis protein histidine kinase CheA